RGERGLTGATGARGERGKDGEFNMAELAGIFGVLGVLQSKISNVEVISNNIRLKTDALPSTMQEALCKEMTNGKCFPAGLNMWYMASPLATVAQTAAIVPVTVQVTALQGQVAALQGQVAALQGQATVLNTTSLATATAVTALRPTVINTGNIVNNANQNITRLGNAVNNQTTNITKLGNQVNNITNVTNQTNTKVDNITNVTNQTNTKVDNITNVTNATNNQITNLTNVTNATNNQITNLTNVTNATNNQITNLTNVTNQTNTKVDNITNVTNLISEAQVDICESECIQSIINKIETINENTSELWIEISVPIVFCSLVDGLWVPARDYIDVSVTAGVATATQLEFEELAKSNETLCDLKNKQEAYAAVPDSWLLRPEHHRPQVIFQFAEKTTGPAIGSAKYAISIPHPRKDYSPGNKSPLPSYKRGNWEMIFVLSDNSKIVIHALNAAEGQKVLKAAMSIVDRNYLKGSYLSKNGLLESNNPLKKIEVQCRYAKYFPTGRKDMKPAWVKYFE
ncbi:hypothetical protein VB654_15925, partial [Nodularia sp. UHCC 0506]|nr:hypothetical protein [Nodularia sp. UHCC 0506]